VPRKRPRNIYDIRKDIDKYPIRKRESFQQIREEDFWEHYEIAKAYSMLQVTGFFDIYQCMRYIKVNNIPGDLVECGCFLGGSSIFIAMMRKLFGLEDRVLHVFDTFTGFPEGSVDKRKGQPSIGPSYEDFFESVRDNFEQTVGTDNIVFHQGVVEETLEGFNPGPLALMRLDTDYYPSTQKEFEVLYPLLVEDGVLIVDDYGQYEGSRKATDEYLATLDRKPLLALIDSGVVSGVKPRST
jgi:O-methyltransferase